MSHLGALAVAQGRHARGVLLLAAEVAANGPTGLVHTPDLRIDGRASLERARAALGEQAYLAAWADGQAMALDEAVASALGDVG